MAHDLPKKLVTEYDLIPEATGQGRLVGLPRIPDPRLAHKVKSGVMNHYGPFTLGFGPEKDRRAEDALERCDEPPLLGSSLLHTKWIKHFRRAAELYRLTLLTNCQRGEEDRNEAVLAPGQPVGRVTGHLERELAVSPLVKKLSGRGLLDRKSAEYERPWRKPEILVRFLTSLADARDGLGAANLLLWNDQIGWKIVENRPGRAKLMALLPTRSESDRLHFAFQKLTSSTPPGGSGGSSKAEGSRVGESEAKAVPFSLLRLMR
jgi:hypothetical protein